MTPSSATSTTRGRVSVVVDRGEGWLIAPQEAHPRALTDSSPTAQPPPPADAAAPDTSAALDPVASPSEWSSAVQSGAPSSGAPPQAPSARSLDSGARDTVIDAGADIETFDPHVETFDPHVEAFDEPAPDLAPPPRPVVAVVGLAPRCGASTVARWVAAALAARDPEGAAIVSTVAPRGTGALRTSGAARLARGLDARALEPVRAAGRLCLVDSEAHSPLSIAATYLAPLVLDVGHGVPPDAALSVADHVLLVASPEVEPALAEVVAQSMASSAPEPTVVLDRALEDARWDARADVVLPESRLAARRAAAGREARGEIGLAVSELAAALEASLWH